MALCLLAPRFIAGSSDAEFMIRQPGLPSFLTAGLALAENHFAARKTAEAQAGSPMNGAEEHLRDRLMRPR